ncbi:MAG TPA: PAS domain-containing protein [Trichocoleus sp.]
MVSRWFPKAVLQQSAGCLRRIQLWQSGWLRRRNLDGSGASHVNQELFAGTQQGHWKGFEPVAGGLLRGDGIWQPLLEAIPIGVWVHNRFGKLVYANRAAYDLFGFEQLPAGPLDQLSAALSVYREGTEELYPAQQWPLVRSLQGEASWAEDLELHSPTGILHLEATAAPVFRGSTVEYVISTFQDITVRKTTARILAHYSLALEAEITERAAAWEQSEVTQNMVLGAIPDLLIRFSSDGICLGVMNRGEVPLLFTPEELVDRHLSTFLPSPMAEERLHLIRQALLTGETQVHEYQFLRHGALQYEESRIVPSTNNEVLIIIRDVTERKQAEKALKESQALYQSLTEVLPHCLYRIDLEGRLIFANPAFLNSLGLPLENCLGKTAYDFYPAHLADKYTADNQRVIQTGIVLRTVEAHQVPATGEKIYVQVVKSPVHDATGQITGVQGVFWDMTDLKRTQDELDTQRQFLRQVIDNMPSAVFVKDLAGRFIAVNRVSAAMYGKQPEEMIGKVEAEFNPHLTPTDVASIADIDQRVMSQRLTVQQEQQMPSADGQVHWYQTIVSPFVSLTDEVQGIIGNCIDITERKTIEAALQKANSELERLATLDSLTKVANRRRFDEYLEQEWQRLAREGQPLSLILLDVDYFKIYNDFYGHQRGDDCLIEVAQAITRSVKRAADLVARYGGEEFAVILPNTRRVGAIVVAETIQAEIAKLQIAHPNSTVSSYVTASLGIASAVPGSNGTCDELVAVADAALYQAKRRGRNRYWVRLL